MYYEDEYEDYDDYEDYCPNCLHSWDYCFCPSAWEVEHCECGALIDAQGYCPYCDYTPENDPHEVGER